MTQGIAYLTQLGAGVDRFRRRIFPMRRALFERLANAQHPKALFLTCADSRIVPALITQTGPGDLFIERNPGNIVPVSSPESVGVSASIEYAVVALGVPHIIVCGHSDCGAVKGMLHPEKLAAMPSVARWLGYGEEARRMLPARAIGGDEEERLRRLTRLNVLVQIEHLKTHPCVQAGMLAERLTLHAWVYEIDTGAVWAYDPALGEFAPFPS